MMLKQSTSDVLASFRPSTYPRGYASVLHSLRPCWTACLSILRECSPVVLDVPAIEVPLRRDGFPQPASSVIGFTSRRLSGPALPFHVSFVQRQDCSCRSVVL